MHRSCCDYHHQQQPSRLSWFASSSLQGLWLTLLLASLVVVIPASHGQRVKEGCYDSNPVRCVDLEEIQKKDRPNLQEVESLCLRLAVDVFPTREIFQDVERHAEYINAIDASDKFCDEVGRFYEHCSFCLPKFSVPNNLCQSAYTFARCGDKVNKEDLLQFEITDGVHLFESVEDIDATCEVFHNSQHHPDIVERELQDLPLSIDLCLNLALARPLCPDLCPGGCFTDENPPTCDLPDDFNISMLNDTDPAVVCAELSAKAFFFANYSTTNNISQHQEWLSAVSGEDDFCDNYHLSYPFCPWCLKEGETSLCFNDEYPATCDEPTHPSNNPSSSAVAGLVYNKSDPSSILSGTGLPCTLSILNADLSAIDPLDVSTHTGNILIHEQSTLCEEARRHYHRCVWCSPTDEDVKFCAVQDYCSYVKPIPERIMSEILQADPFLNETYHYNLTHSIVNNKTFCDNESSWGQSDNWDPLTYASCFAAVLRAQLCPEVYCESEPAEPLSDEYLGATTTSQKRAIIWMSRASAILSFFGACYVIWDTMRDPKTRDTVYHQLLCGMAVHDILTALAWALATAPINHTALVEGAAGNDATCICQGFFIQLGFGSVFYNVSLSIYYVLVIAYNWREFQLKKIRLYLHGIPILLALALAFGGIPIYDKIAYVCHIPPYSSDANDGGNAELWPVLVFVVLPLGISIALITSAMLLVYCKVRKRSGASKKWRLGVGKASKMEQAVFWQCVFYVMAFYVSWPIMFSVYLASVDSRGPFGLTMVIAFVAPLQGFSNFLVYVRPKLLAHLEEQRRKREVGIDGWQSSRVMGFVQAVLPLHLFMGDNESTDKDQSMGNYVDPSVAIASIRWADEIIAEYNTAKNDSNIEGVDASTKSGNETMAAHNNQNSSQVHIPLPMPALSESIIEENSCEVEVFVEEQNSHLSSEPLAEATKQTPERSKNHTSLGKGGTVEGSEGREEGSSHRQVSSDISGLQRSRVRRDYRQYLLPSSS